MHFTTPTLKLKHLKHKKMPEEDTGHSCHTRRKTSSVSHCRVLKQAEEPKGGRSIVT